MPVSEAASERSISSSIQPPGVAGKPLGCPKEAKSSPKNALEPYDPWLQCLVCRIQIQFEPAKRLTPDVVLRICRWDSGRFSAHSFRPRPTEEASRKMPEVPNQALACGSGLMDL